MRGFRHVMVLVGVLFIILILILTGCSQSGVRLKTTVDKRPITRTIELYAEEPYTVQENRIVAENCIERHYSEMNDSRFNR